MEEHSRNRHESREDQGGMEWPATPHRETATKGEKIELATSDRLGLTMRACEL